jgi:hypothetical protein
MMKISGRLRQTSTQMPAGKLMMRRLEMRANASASPKINEKTIAIAAIWRLTRKPSSRKRKLFPVHSHSQFPGSNR